MASAIPRAVSKKKLRLGQQTAVLQTIAPDLPSVAELSLSFAKRPGSHVGARKFLQLGLPALVKQNPKMKTNTQIDYANKPKTESKPTLTLKTVDNQTASIDLSAKHSSTIMTELQQAALDPKSFIDSLTPVQPKKTA